MDKKCQTGISSSSEVTECALNNRKGSNMSNHKIQGMNDEQFTLFLEWFDEVAKRVGSGCRLIETYLGHHRELLTDWHKRRRPPRPDYIVQIAVVDLMTTNPHATEDECAAHAVAKLQELGRINNLTRPKMNDLITKQRRMCQ